MANSFDQALAAFQPAFPLLVAYSGGADSTALLLACHRKWPKHVNAVHVHHGLQAAADAFVRHCEDVCQALGVPLTVVHLDARHGKGQSPEDAARIARYAAIEQVARHLKAPSIALAQHQDDQVETMLLALSRGAGLPGLSAMGAMWQRPTAPELTYYRPLLGVPAPQLRQWLTAHGHGFVEDPSNQDISFTRNRIRHQLMPALAAVFPDFRDTFTRSSRHMAEAQGLLTELATMDLAAVGNPPTIVELQKLSPSRQTNVLRYWLKTAHAASASSRQMQELLKQIACCTTRGHAIDIKVGLGQVVRRGTVLHWYNLGLAEK
jgi:tRNA(Ile)-lysidine synthase